MICFEDIKKKKTFQEEYPDWEKGLIQGKKRLMKIDLHRNNAGKIEEIYSKYPPLLEWWNNIPVKDNVI